MRKAHAAIFAAAALQLAGTMAVCSDDFFVDSPVHSGESTPHDHNSGHEESADDWLSGCEGNGSCSDADHFCCGSYGGSFCDEIWDPVTHTHFSRRGTPLIHTFFLEPAALHRDLFVDYRIANNVDGTTDEQELETELEWALTKRLGIVIEAPFLSLDPDVDGNTSGFGDLVVAGRALLVDGDECMLAVNLAVSSPTGDETRGLGAGEAIISPTVSLWQDLGNWLSFHAQFGPESGTETGQTDMFWAFALTKSMQGPTLCGDCHHTDHCHHDDHFHFDSEHGEHLHFEPGLTSFILELNGSTGLSGPNDGNTFFELIPGISYVPWELTEFRCGFRFPLYLPKRLDNQLILSYIRNF